MFNMLYTTLLFVLMTGFITKPKKFPEINYRTSEGKEFTNKDFLGKETVVVLFHLGCPPAMALLKDLETINPGTGEYPQIIGIAENTPAQIKAFNSDGDNDWADLRKSHQLKPVAIPLIGECDPGSLESENEMEGSGVQCRNLAKKIKTSSSPTLVYVNGQGNIITVKKGYVSDEAPLEARMKYVTEF